LLLDHFQCSLFFVSRRQAAAIVAADLARAPFQPTLATKHRQELRQAEPNTGAGASGGADGGFDDGADRGADGVAPAAASTAATTAEVGIAGSRARRATAPASEPAPAAEPPLVFSGNACTRTSSSRQAATKQYCKAEPEPTQSGPAVAAASDATSSGGNVFERLSSAQRRGLQAKAVAAAAAKVRASNCTDRLHVA